MRFKVTTLVENTVAIMSGKKLIGEHGLSFLIETRGQRLLFDTGHYMAFENNARVLGIELAGIDKVVLSHGHHDHTGGLKHLLDGNSNFALYAHPDVFARKLEKRKGRYRKIGIAVSKNELAKRGVKLILDTGPVEIAPKIMTTGEIPMQTDFESVAEGFFIEKSGRKIPDTLADDLSLILKTDKGPVVVLGCSHRGVINTLSHVQNILAGKSIYAVMGGMHLVKATGEKLETVMQHLQRFNLEKIVVGHCTGNEAIQALYARFKDKIILNTVGNVITF
jgi:7,8-dihydropterin-6-yl-methyl-4-(beta-D-ribofuranosyl)aminobenzene 5'-phosphate synthase